jgi:hypothetical protein
MSTASHSRATAVVFVVLAVLGTASREACAQRDTSAVATELFYSGRDLMNAGNYVEGCPKLAQSARLDAKVGTLARLAECEEKLGKMASARAHWQQATSLARAQGDERLAHAQAELTRVDKLVPKVAISMAGPPPLGLALRVDGDDVGVVSLGLPLPLDAGRHTLSVSATAKKPFTTTVTTLADGKITRVEVPPLEDAPPAVVELAPPSPAPDRAHAVPPPYWTTSRKVGAIVGGVGVATAVVGIVFGVVAKVELDASNGDGCHDNNCGNSDSTAHGQRTSAFSDGTIGTVLLVAGGVVAASGLTVFLLAPGGREAAGPSVSLSGTPGWLSVGGRF